MESVGISGLDFVLFFFGGVLTAEVLLTHFEYYYSIGLRCFVIC